MKDTIKEIYPLIRQPEESDVASLVKTSGLTNGQALGLGGVVIAAFLFCYADVFMFLVDQWKSNDIYSHGFLIPWISLYLVWIRRGKLASLEPHPNYVGGLFLLFTGLLMLVSGRIGGVILVQEISLIPTIAGIVLFLLGSRFFRALWFPIAYLFFMIPVWEIITDRFHFPFQVFSATFAVNLIQLVGIPAHQRINYIELPNIILEVARGCSGVNYLIAVVAICVPLAYLFLKGWKRIALVCFAVTVAVLSNGLRIFLIAVLSYYDIGGNIHGPFHILQALFVSVMGYGAIFLGLFILIRIPPVSSPLKIQTVATPHYSHSNLNKRNVLFGAVFAAGLLLFAGGYSHFLYKPKPVYLRADLQNLPLQIDAWEGKDAATPYNPYAELHVDHELSRTYYKSIRNMKRAVHLYVGYFETQKQNKELIHSNVTAYFKNATKTTFRLNAGKSIEVNKVFIKDEGSSLLSFFWYDLDDRVVTNPYLAKLYTSWSGLVSSQTNGSVIWVSSEISDGVSQDDASSDMEEFIQKVFPLLSNYLPHQEP